MMTLPYRTWGLAKNPSVVFLHGLFGSLLDWEGLAPLFDDTHFVVAIDLPGHGDAVLPQTASLQSAVRLIKDTLLFLSCHDVTLVGYSLGGRLGLHLAKECPELIREVILESSSPGLDDPVQRAFRAQSDLAASERLLQYGLGPFLEQWYQNPMFGSIAQHPDFDALLQNRLAGNPDYLAWVLREFSPGVLPSLWDELPNLPVVGFVCGERDERYIEIGQRMYQECSGIHRRVLLQAGHLTHFEQPVLFAGFIRALLERTHKTV